jgi:hypothetical protein
MHLPSRATIRPALTTQVRVGRADFVVVPGETLAELVVARPTRTWVVSAGRIVARDGKCIL